MYVFTKHVDTTCEFLPASNLKWALDIICLLVRVTDYFMSRNDGNKVLRWKICIKISTYNL